MVERQPGSVEHYANPEALEAAGRERETAVGERLEKGAKQAERTRTAERPDKARYEAEKLARSAAAEKTAAEHAKQPPKTERPLTQKDVDDRYRQTLRQVQSQLPAPSRAFSKVIHNPVIDKASDAIGNTVARPNLVIAGALGAIASIIVYFIARTYGYPLSGFETIALFIIGWLFGVIVEYARLGFSKKQR